MRRSFGRLMLMALVGAPLALVATAVPAAAAVQKDITGSATLPLMHPGQTAWVSILWQGAHFDADSFRMTATSPGASITYPANTGSFSSLYGSSTLLASATDFAALKIAVKPGTTQDIAITVSVSYDLHQDNGNAKTTPTTQILQATLPVAVVNGPAITPITATLGSVVAGTATWRQYSVRGEKPGVTSLTARLSPPPGITIAYPAAAVGTSLSQSSTLDVGVTDYFAFEITVNGAVVPGTYDLTVAMTYGSGQTQTAVVPLSVTR